MMFLVLGLVALYAALLLTIYYVPLRRAIEVYPDVPESAASVPSVPEEQPEEVAAA